MTPAPLSVAGLERVAARGWRGTVEQPLGDWLLRAGSGFTGRANSVLPLGSPECSLPEALARVDDFYRAQHLPAIFQIPEDVPGSELAVLDAELAQRGWRNLRTAWCMTATLSDVVQRCPLRPELPAAQLDSLPSDRWLGGYLYRGAALPPSAVAVLVRADRPIFATIADDAGLAGVARGAVDAGWLGVTAVTVSIDRRRSGVGRQLMGELARWAARLDGVPVEQVYLQVDEANDAAITMYERLGFTLHHRYHYRQPAP